MRRAFPALLVLASLLLSLVVYGRLPERMVTHWSVDGRPDGWSGRAVGAFLLPAAMVGSWALAQVLPMIDPRRANYAKFRHTYDLVIAAIIAVMAVLHVGTIGSALGWPVSVPRLAPLGTAVLFLIIGNTLPRARPNWFYGIRTPWTLSSERVWERTHRVGGYLMMAGGAVMALSALLTPRRAFAVLVGTVTVTTAAALAYSYVLWRRETRG